MLSFFEKLIDHVCDDYRGAKNNLENYGGDTWTFGLKGQNYHRGTPRFYAHATDNNCSIKKESKMIEMVFIQILFITPHQTLIQKTTPNFPI